MQTTLSATTFLTISLTRYSNDPLKTCTGHTTGETKHDYDYGRLYQEMDCQAQGGFGDGDY